MEQEDRYRVPQCKLALSITSLLERSHAVLIFDKINTSRETWAMTNSYPYSNPTHNRPRSLSKHRDMPTGICTILLQRVSIIKVSHSNLVLPETK